MRRGLLFLPSLVLGVAGALGVALGPGLGPPSAPLGALLGWGALTAAGLLAAAWLLERRCSSFRWASQLLERTVRRLRLPLPASVALALATGVSEELFFRGTLLTLLHPASLALPAQAVLFGALHPVPRRGWAYPAFAVVAGAAFGAVTLASGSLLPAVVAHVAINLQGLLAARRGVAGPTG